MTRPDDPFHVFNRLHPSLQGIAFRMLGSSEGAQAVVQGAWLRWREAEHHVRARAEDWLAVVTARLAIRRLRTVPPQSPQFVGSGLPSVPFREMPASRGLVCNNVENDVKRPLTEGLSQRDGAKRLP